MKFMKLGSKPDSFQTDGKDGRFVVTELPTNIIVKVGNVKFYLHKFPLMSKSSLLQRLITTNNEERHEIQIHDIPGGAASFEICAKFCYNMTVTLNAHNVAAARCAAEYLEMHETVEKGNLIYKIEVFLKTIFRSWKDSIIVLQTTKSLLPWSEELKLVNHCIDAIACKASVDASTVDWSYTYTRNQNRVRNPQSAPNDWWLEDLCELELDLYKRIVVAIKDKGSVSTKVIGEAIKVYTYKRLPSFGNGDNVKNGSMLEAIVRLLPEEKCSVSSSFLLKLLKLASLLDCSEMCRRDLVRRIGWKLEEVSVVDLVVYDVDTVTSIVEEFVMKEKYGGKNSPKVIEDDKKFTSSDGSKMIVVANLVDGYLAEIAKDEHLALSKFFVLAKMVSGDSRPVHDALYRAIDMYLKEHPSLTKSEKKKLCSLMDCSKLSSTACTHAIQNERLPLRLIVQVLFHEQARTSTGPDSSSGGSYGSSRTTATSNTTEDNWVPPIKDHLEESFKSMNLNANAPPKSMLLSRNMKH